MTYMFVLRNLATNDIDVKIVKGEHLCKVYYIDDI